MTSSGELKVPLISVLTPVVERRRDDHTSWLFLSLYLLLFAFFMMLNTFTSFESEKRAAVISSVLDAFTQVASPGSDSLQGGFFGTEAQVRRFQDAVTDIFETAIPLTSMRVTVPGTRMDVDLPTQIFFNDDSVVVRNPLPLLDRVVATVSSPPTGVKYELAIIAYVPVGAGEDLPTDMTSQIARVGNIARALDAKGMPPEAVTIGMERGDQRLVKFIFFAIEDSSDGRTALSFWGEGAS